MTSADRTKLTEENILDALVIGIQAHYKGHLPFEYDTLRDHFVKSIFKEIKELGICEFVTLLGGYDGRQYLTWLIFYSKDSVPTLKASIEYALQVHSNNPDLGEAAEERVREAWRSEGLPLIEDFLK